MSVSYAIVDWIDSASDGGWKGSRDVMPEPAKCQSVGYVVADDKVKIVLAKSRSTDGINCPWGDLMVIPKGCIKKIRRFKP